TPSASSTTAAAAPNSLKRLRDFIGRLGAGRRGGGGEPAAQRLLALLVGAVPADGEPEEDAAGEPEGQVEAGEEEVAGGESDQQDRPDEKGHAGEAGADLQHRVGPVA